MKRLGSATPLCIIGSYRSDERPELPDELPDHTHLIHLGRLPAESIVELTSSMLGTTGTEPQVVDLLQRETEGNALFLVEVVRALAEEAGTLGGIKTMSLPRSVLAGGVQHILRRRLRRMPEWGQPLLRLAAVRGRQMDQKLLTHLAAGNNLEQWLTVGAAAAVLEVSDGQWRFSHDKLRETVLAELTAEELQALHRQIAEGIEAVYGTQSGYAQPLYEHWKGSNDQVRALPYATELAEQLLYSAPTQTVIAFVEAALAGVADDVDTERQAHLWRVAGDAHQSAGNFDKAFKALETSLRYATAIDSPVRRASTLGSFAWAYLLRSEYNEAIRYSKEAIALAEQVNNTPVLLYALSLMGIAYYQLGEYEWAQTVGERTLKLAEGANLPSRIAAVANNLGNIADALGQMQAARNYYEQCLAICEAIGNRRVAFSALNNLGRVVQDDRNVAQHYFIQALALARELGIREHLATVLANLGNFHVENLELEQAEQYIEEGLAAARSSGDRRNEVYLLNHLAMCRLEQNALDQAQQVIETAQRILHESNNLLILPLVLQTAGIVAHAHGDAARSEAAYAQGLALAHERREQMSIASLLLHRGLSRWIERRYGEAATDLQEALSTYRAADSYMGEIHALAYFALVRANEGAYQEAEQHLAAATDRAGTNPHRTISALLTVVQAFTLCCSGEYGRSAELCDVLGDGVNLNHLQRNAILLPTRQRVREHFS